MKTSITKSARTNGTQTMPPAPSWANLSFVTHRYDGRTKHHRVTDWLDVPLETYLAGGITGYRVVDELMAWAKQHPSECRWTLQSVLEAAQAVLAQPTEILVQVDKRGAAAMVVWAMMDFLKFAALHADHAGYCNREIAGNLAFQAGDTKRIADKRREFVQRMQAARAAKKFASVVVPKKASSTSSKK